MTVPFAMLGGDDAAFCEGDACVIPGAVNEPDAGTEVDGAGRTDTRAHVDADAVLVAARPSGASSD